MPSILEAAAVVFSIPPGAIVRVQVTPSKGNNNRKSVAKNMQTPHSHQKSCNRLMQEMRQGLTLQRLIRP